MKENIKKITNFKGNLPFRYLGVPMTRKELAFKDYMKLIDKIVERITH